MSEELEVSQSASAKAGGKRGFARVPVFFKQVVSEMKKVTRPTWQELRNYTGVVLGFVTVVMVIISLLDWGLLQLVILAFSPSK